jgi:hypothetical protein
MGTLFFHRLSSLTILSGDFRMKLHVPERFCGETFFPDIRFEYNT